MENRDRTQNQGTKGTPDPGESQNGSEKERSRETQGGTSGQPGRPEPSGVPNEGRGSGRQSGQKPGRDDEDDDELDPRRTSERDRSHERSPATRQRTSNDTPKVG